MNKEEKRWQRVAELAAKHGGVLVADGDSVQCGSSGPTRDVQVFRVADDATDVYTAPRLGGRHYRLPKETRRQFEGAINGDPDLRQGGLVADWCD